MSRKQRFPAWRVSALAIALAAAVSAAATAQEALPTGRAVIDRYIEALGGRDAILAQTGRHAWGSIEIPAQGMSGELELYAQPPNKLWVKVTLAGIGDVLSGFDGTVGWGINPMMGPVLVDSLELDQARQQADFYSNLYQPDQIEKLETVGREAFAGKDCYKVRIRSTWGEEYHEFFAVDSGLMVGSQRSQETRMGSVDVVTIVGDWRLVDGIQVPFKSTQRTMGIENIAAIDSLHVMAVPDSLFVLPPEIRALIKQ